MYSRVKGVRELAWRIIRQVGKMAKGELYEARDLAERGIRKVGEVEKEGGEGGEIAREETWMGKRDQWKMYKKEWYKKP
jgi:hypothetical protein